MSMSELLARLNAGTASYLRDGRGGLPELTEHDIAAAFGMTKIPEGARYLARLKWCDQRVFFRDTAICLYTRLCDFTDFSDLAKRRSHRPGLVLDMCKMAVTEYCRSVVCQTCHGTCYAPNAHGVVSSCPGCRGCGVQASDRKALVVEYLEIDPTTFYRSWDDVYGMTQRVLIGWESMALSALSAKIRRVDDTA